MELDRWLGTDQKARRSVLAMAVVAVAGGAGGKIEEVAELT